MGDETILPVDLTWKTQRIFRNNKKKRIHVNDGMRMMIMTDPLSLSGKDLKKSEGFFINHRAHFFIFEICFS